MKTLKALLIAVFFIPVSVFSAEYQLQSWIDPDLGPVLYDGDSASFNAIHTVNRVEPSSFIYDQYGFSLAQDSSVSYSFSNAEEFYNSPVLGEIQVVGADFYYIDLIRYVWDETDRFWDVAETIDLFSLPETGVLTLAAGLYDLQLDGSILGSAGAAYSGTFTVTAVPLPAAIWLFGSALMGLMIVGRRRKLHAA